MPLHTADLRRKGQFPLLLGSGALPALTLLLIYIAPEHAGLSAVFAAVYAVLGEACLCLRGKARLGAGLAGCAILMGLGLWLLPAGGALLIPVCCMALLGMTLPIGGWPRDREPPTAWYAAGLVFHLIAQVLVNASRHTGEHPGLVAAAPMLLVSFILFAALAMLSINRISMDQAALGRQRIPASMRRMNTLLTGALLILTLLISALPAVIRAAEQAWDLLVALLARLMDWLAGLLPQSSPTGGGLPGSMELGGLGDAAAEPSLLAVILEKAAMVIAGIAGVALAVLAARFLFRRLKRLARRLRELMRRYAATSCEDYEDEITDTREDGLRTRVRPLRTLRRSAMPRDDKALPPGVRIRRRYARMRFRHTEWHSSFTARETLPPDAARLYEQARYSDHPVTEEDAEVFIRGTRSAS